MKKVNRNESYFKTQDGCELFFQTWQPEGEKPRGTLVVTHGMAEHSEAYNLFATHMVNYGWKIIAWDLRGHGRSEGKRGYIADFALFYQDLKLLMNLLKSESVLEGPHAILGHSMGGLISIRYAQEYGLDDAKLLALSSPLLGVAIEVPKIKDVAAHIMVKLMPTMTMANEIRHAKLSRDREILRGYPLDPLRHDRISPIFYFSLLKQMQLAFESASQTPGPLFVQAAGHDEIVSLAEARRFYSEVGTQDKWLKVYEDCYHEIFNDLDREKVYADLNSFLLERMT